MTDLQSIINRFEDRLLPQLKRYMWIHMARGSDEERTNDLFKEIYDTVQDLKKLQI